jgi:hypothetical protein
MRASQRKRAVPVKKRIATLIAALALGGEFFPAALPAGAEDSRLADSDCVKCHAGQVGDLTLAGAAHEEVSCSGCHRGHPPRSMGNLPRCRECHDGEGHFDKPSCGGCHSNPHMPLWIVMPSGTSDPCRECHPSQVALIDRGNSLHSDYSCSDCHSSHRQTPLCLDCHEPHIEGEKAQNCTGCHYAHMPSPAVFDHDVSDRDCAPCHGEVFEQIRANRTGHGRRSCVSCHQRRHGTLPQCSTCHGLPHRLSETALFEECGRCHSTAHDLNVWPE